MYDRGAKYENPDDRFMEILEFSFLLNSTKIKMGIMKDYPILILIHVSRGLERLTLV